MRELLFQALASAGDGAFIVDEDQRIIYWNQAAERILGHRSSRIHGRFCYGMLNGQDAQGGLICRRHCSVAATALGGGPIRNYDMSVRTRSDNPRWINMSTFVFPTNGHDAGSLVVHLFRNITQRKQNEELLNKVLTAVEKLRDRGQPDRWPQAPVVDSGAELTDREREVLSLLARGSSTDEIAQALSISTSTVRNHIRNIMHKFEVHSRLETVLYALRHGLVTPD